MLNQKQITKRILGRWLHARKLQPVARFDGTYTLTSSNGRLNFNVAENGMVYGQMFSTNAAFFEGTGNLAGLINLIKSL